MGKSTGYQARLSVADGTGLDGIRATLAVGSGTSGFNVTAIRAGSSGNNITVTVVDPASPSQAFGIVVSGTDITINLKTDGSGVETTTANEIVNAINTNAACMNLVVASTNAVGGGGVVAAAAEANLAGGALATHGFTQITNIRNFSMDGGTTNTVDATTADSADRSAEIQIGFIQPGNFNFEVVYDPTDTTHRLLEAARRSGAEQTFRFTLADIDRTTFDFKGFVTNLGMEVELENVVTRSATISVNGPIIENYGS